MNSLPTSRTIAKAAVALSMAALAVTAASGGNDNVAEEVAWVVGDQPIWKSDIEEMYQQMLYERVPIPGDPYCVIPEQMAIEKLYLHQADADTVEVQPTMVAARVDAQINNYINAFGSREKLEQNLGKTVPEFREQLTEFITNRNRIEQVQQSLTKDIKLTPNEVRRYFNELPPDSVPWVAQQVEVQILSVQPAIPRQEIDDIKDRLRSFAERVNNGETEFSTLAILYSQDPGSASRGGEIGFMSRSMLEPEYAAVAFNLNDPKRVSKIVETTFGYHIIQLIEKRGDRINTRHILLQPRVSDKDLVDAVNSLDSLRNVILDTDRTFEEAVAVFSHDKDTRANRGVMVNSQTGGTRFEMSQLPQEVAKAVAQLQPGEISRAFIMKDPRSSRDMVAIVKLTSRKEGHRANLSDDYQLLRSQLEASRGQQILDDWLAKKMSETYIRIEEGWRDCEFQHDGWIKQ